MPKRKKYVRYVPCSSPHECGNQVRWKGPNHTGFCRECYLLEIRTEDGRRRQTVITQTRKMRHARAQIVRPSPPPPLAVEPMLLEQSHLWFERDRVFGYIETNVGESVRLELSKAELDGRWDSWRSRPWLRFDQVDELFCVLGLWVGDLGDPVYSGSAKRYPALAAV